MAEWRAIPGFDGWYEVSSAGEVRSWRKRGKGSGSRRHEPIHLRQATSSSGYPGVRLYRDGVGRTSNVHRLVMLSFVGECPEGLEVCHGDGDRLNNALGNLRYDTKSANARDREAHNERTRGYSRPELSGELNPIARFTDQEVEGARARVLAGERQVDVARDMGVPRATMSKWINHRTYRRSLRRKAQA